MKGEASCHIIGCIISYFDRMSWRPIVSAQLIKFIRGIDDQKHGFSSFETSIRSGINRVFKFLMIKMKYILSFLVFLTPQKNVTKNIDSTWHLTFLFKSVSQHSRTIPIQTPTLEQLTTFT